MGNVFRQITREMRREISGVILVAIGVLSYLSQIVSRTGWLGKDLGRGFQHVFGLFSWVVPAVIIMSGIRYLLNQPSISKNRRSWGAVLVFLALSADFFLVSPLWGGQVGRVLAMTLMHAVGKTGGIFITFIIFIVGILLITGGSLVAGAEVIGNVLTDWSRYVVKGISWVMAGIRDWIYPEEPSVPVKRPRKSKSPAVSLTLETETLSSPHGVADESIGGSRVPERELIRDTPAANPATAAPFSRPLFSGDRPYMPPPLSLLAMADPSAAARQKRGPSPMERGQVLTSSLRQFGIDVKLGEVNQGPTITRFEIVPPPGVKVSRIVNLADDIALSLAATGVRIEAPIPGKSAVGIEVPNNEISMVLLREVLESQAFAEAPSPLSVALGRDVAGAPVVAALDQMPHLLVAGATGAGKSVLINVLITSLLYRSSPDVVRLLLIDPKVVELSVYNGIPHLLSPVVTDPKKAAGALRWAVAEMERRYRLFADRGVRDVSRFNQVAEEDKLSYIVIIIDELADLMMVSPADVEESIARLAQMARAAGIHLVVATQRPSVDVITGTIKANVPSRIAFAVSSQVDSRTILDGGGAEKLLGKGDMLFSPVGSIKPKRVQGAFVREKEIEQIVEYLRKNSADLVESDDPIEFVEDGPAPSVAEETDSLFEQAVRIVIENQQASTSMLQRRLRVGYTRAARLIDAMEERGFVGPPEGAKARVVHLSEEQFRQLFHG